MSESRGRLRDALYARMEDITFRSALAVVGAVGVAVVAGAVMLVVVLTAHNNPATAKTDPVPRQSASSGVPPSPAPSPTPSPSPYASPSPSPDLAPTYVSPPPPSTQVAPSPTHHTARPTTPPPSPTSPWPTMRWHPSFFPTSPSHQASAGSR